MRMRRSTSICGPIRRARMLLASMTPSTPSTTFCYTHRHTKGISKTVLRTQGGVLQVCLQIRYPSSNGVHLAWIRGIAAESTVSVSWLILSLKICMPVSPIMAVTRIPARGSSAASPARAAKMPPLATTKGFTCKSSLTQLRHLARAWQSLTKCHNRRDGITAVVPSVGNQDGAVMLQPHTCSFLLAISTLHTRTRFRGRVSA